MAKYAIKREFFPFNYFKPPLSENFLKVAVPFMTPPKFIYKDKAVECKRYEVVSYDRAKIECFMFSPKNKKGSLPCLIYTHGGGFVLPAAGYHYKNAMRYAKEVGCKVWFINYRLAPEHPFPAFFEDCYEAMRYLYENAEELCVDRAKIAVGGDSAGGTLAVGLCLMARDRNYPVKFLFQMLAYPFLDMRGVSESNKKYIDTPMWNSKLSDKIAPMTKVDKTKPNYIYYSPVEGDKFNGLPPAYIESAEFDCLHDDGLIYARLLENAKVSVTVNETKGTMHGFDIKQNAPTTKKVLEDRIEFMKNGFAK